MKLKKLIKDLPLDDIKGMKDLEITGICSHSRLVSPGNLFIARKGTQFDGNRFVPQAIASGAHALLTDIYDPSLKGITQLICSRIKDLESLIAAKFYHFPSRDLFTVGVTGTNGKTTSVYLLKHILDSIGKPSALLGTIEHNIGELHYTAYRTTPESTMVQKYLRESILQNLSSFVMEVSSHALTQGRVSHVDFDAAIFTNLSLDHLDYHGSWEQYYQAKNKLFKLLEGSSKDDKIAIVNVDTPWGERLAKECRCSMLCTSIKKQSDVSAHNIQLSESASSFLVRYRGQEESFTIPLAGLFNVSNTLNVIALALHYGVSLKRISSILANFSHVPGRLQRVPNNLSLTIYIDYAHTPDALENVLKTLSNLKKGRLICVFGCGGDRDQSKRSQMGRISERYVDMTFVTSDNPRSEDPLDICRDILKGFKNPSKVHREVDRRLALEKAIDYADPKDIILVAGKGHEKTQVFSHKTIEFDEAKILGEICALRT